MDITELKYIQTLAEEKNFSRAAEKLYITQSALSQQIKKIESEIGFSLFNRTSKMVELTNNGERFLRYADKVLADYSDLENEIARIVKTEKQDIVFGASPYISPRISGVLPDFIASHPEVNFQFVEAVNKELLEMLRSSQIDMAIYPFFPYNNNDEKIRKYTLREEFVYTVMSSSHPLAGKDSVTLEDIAPYQLIFSSSRAGIRDIVMQSFEAASLQPKEPFDITSRAARLPFLNGGAITFSMSSLNEWEDADNIIRIPLEPHINFSVSLIMLLGRRMTKPMQDLYGLLKDALTV